MANLLLAWLILVGCDAGSFEHLLLSSATAETQQASSNTTPSEPLVPTPMPGTADTSAQVAATTPSSATERVRHLAPAHLPEPYTLRWRTGVGVPDGKSPLIYAWPESYPGWYLNWTVGITGSAPGSAEGAIQLHVPDDARAGMEFAPMVRTSEGQVVPSPDILAAVVNQLPPGRTWLIGNEPDVKWQDNATPEEYARAYHLAHETIKEADPTAQVAIAGLSQITPLRIEYLNRVWDFYANEYGEEMPVDVWNMHAFVLQEKANDWGVDIPPGMIDFEQGMLWEIEDHNDLSLVEGQVRLMREWMAEHGQREKPLWITEYGILMPESYGFYPGTVTAFMLSSYDLFENLRDPELGYAADEDRLVQRWVWFSAGYPLYPTGDLFTSAGEPKQLMQALSAYLATNGE